MQLPFCSMIRSVYYVQQPTTHFLLLDSVSHLPAMMLQCISSVSQIDKGWPIAHLKQDKINFHLLSFESTLPVAWDHRVSFRSCWRRHHCWSFWRCYLSSWDCHWRCNSCWWCSLVTLWGSQCWQWRLNHLRKRCVPVEAVPPKGLPSPLCMLLVDNSMVITKLRWNLCQH